MDFLVESFRTWFKAEIGSLVWGAVVLAVILIIWVIGAIVNKFK